MNAGQRLTQNVWLLQILQIVGAGMLLIWPASVRAQAVVATIPNVGAARVVVVNPVTNKIYVATCSRRFPGLALQGGFSVIDGQTNAATAIPITGNCAGLAVNPVTNKIYVANSTGVMVIDGGTNSTTTLSTSGGTAVAINAVTNKIYVATASSNGEANITVIDGGTNSTTTIAEPNAAGLAPVAIAVNSATNKIYVANRGSSTNPGNITVIDGATNAAVTVSDPDAMSPVSLAVNPNTNKVYVANMGNYPGTNPGNVTVIDGATNSITTISDHNAISPGGPDSVGFAVAVNSTTNKIYVSNEQSNNVTVIDGATNATSTLTDANAVAPIALAVNSSTNMVYVANKGYPGSVTVMNAATNSLTTLIADGGATDAVAVDPMTNRIFAGDGGSVAVIDPSGVATSHTVILSLSGSGFGTVASGPSLNCNGPLCSASFAAGTAVTFTATPASYSTFSWGAACAGDSQCSLTLDSDYFVAANFAMKPGMDFSMQPASSSLAMQAGNPLTDVLTISGTPGAIVQISCLVTESGPIPLNCALSSSSVTLTGSAATTTLTVAVGSPTAELVPARKPHLAGASYAGFLSMPGLVLLGLCLSKARSRTRTRLRWLLCSVLLVFAGLQTGCGSGYGGIQRTYSVAVVGNVVGFSSAIEHETSITVTAP